MLEGLEEGARGAGLSGSYERLSGMERLRQVVDRSLTELGCWSSVGCLGKARGVTAGYIA